MSEREEVSAATLGTVFEQHRQAMARKARRLLQDANVPASVAEADDIVSSAFTKALRNPGAVLQPVPYMYALIRTEVRHLAMRRAEHLRLDQKRVADPLDSPAPYVADFSTLVENREAVHQAMLELSVPQRTAVWATHALGHTRAETAVLMGKHPGTVARHTTRGMTTLRAAFAAVFTAILSAIGLTVGGRLRDSAPVGRPHTDPALPSAQWWPLPWILALSAMGIAACAVIISRLLARRAKLTPPRTEETPPNMVVLCASCNRLNRTGHLDQEQRQVLGAKACHTSEAARQAAGSACQLCGHGGSLASPLDVHHLVPVSRGGSASGRFHGGHVIRRTIREPNPVDIKPSGSGSDLQMEQGPDPSDVAEQASTSRRPSR
ncbi:sigma factor-like helix-turn-helix DNA-binding protein [Streptomyces sp. NPDC048295]|uniref:sigma factor-like helix-turn-helix DNA-binding protein n=1 Tax=Streptomyces sp. NPDC048295 TaxID=3154617 RepID=UPI0034466BF8